MATPPTADDPGGRFSFPAIALPADALVVLVGVAASGKSTFAARHFRPTQVLSSDALRALITDSPTTQGATDDAFDLLHRILEMRLRRGRLTVVDATNVEDWVRAELVRLARRGCPDHPAGDCACPVLDRPPPVDRYRPSRPQDGYVRTRDRTCRHPGCRNHAGWADVDHVIPHADGGPTDCANLCCLCRRHHRLKTHAPGWRFVMAPDGVLTVTTPSGVTRTSRPPGMSEPVSDPPWPGDPPPF
jgi:predicted kinase